jgi:hypothetical protein
MASTPASAIKGNVVLCLTRHQDHCHLVQNPLETDFSLCTCRSKTTQRFVQNIVTNSGAQFYAEAIEIQRLGSGSTTENYQSMVVSTTSTGTPSATSDGSFFTGTNERQTVDSGYPLQDDSDTDNSGRGVRVLSWRRSYTTGQANFTIASIGIVEAGTTLGSGTDPILNVAFVSPTITKTSSDTLKAFVNHTFTGV